MCVLQRDTQSPCSSCSLSTGVHCKVQIRLLHRVLACYFPLAFFKLSCIHYSELYLKRAVLLCTFPRSLAVRKACVGMTFPTDGAGFFPSPAVLENLVVTR